MSNMVRITTFPCSSSGLYHTSHHEAQNIPGNTMLLPLTTLHELITNTIIRWLSLTVGRNYLQAKDWDSSFWLWLPGNRSAELLLSSWLITTFQSLTITGHKCHNLARSHHFCLASYYGNSPNLNASPQPALQLFPMLSYPAASLLLHTMTLNFEKPKIKITPSFLWLDFSISV